MDNDEAGQNALERYFTLGIPLDLNLYTNTLAPYEDLDELMQKAPKKIQGVVKKRKDLFTELVLKKLEKKDVNNYKDYKEIIGYVSFLLSGVKDKKLQKFFLNQAEKITTIDQEFFTKKENIPNIQEQQKLQKAPLQEKECFFLSIALKFEDPSLLEKVDLKFFLNKEIKHIIEYIKETKSFDEKTLLENFSDSESLKQAIFESSRLEIDSEKQEKYILNTYNIIKKENIEKIIRQLRVKENIAIQEKHEKKAEQIEYDILRLKKLQAEK